MKKHISYDDYKNAVNVAKSYIEQCNTVLSAINNRIENDEELQSKLQTDSNISNKLFNNILKSNLYQYDLVRLATDLNS